MVAAHRVLLLVAKHVWLATGATLLEEARYRIYTPLSQVSQRRGDGAVRLVRSSLSAALPGVATTAPETPLRESPAQEIWDFDVHAKPGCIVAQCMPLVNVCGLLMRVATRPATDAPGGSSRCRNRMRPPCSHLTIPTACFFVRGIRAEPVARLVVAGAGAATPGLWRTSVASGRRWSGRRAASCGIRRWSRPGSAA